MGDLLEDMLFCMTPGPLPSKSMIGSKNNGARSSEQALFFDFQRCTWLHNADLSKDMLRWALAGKRGSQTCPATALVLEMQVVSVEYCEQR